MVTIIRGEGAGTEADLLDAMFEDRKRLFVDLLGWDVPVVGGSREMDQYDTAEALYLIALDELGGHAGSLRLLPTEGAHILDTLFPQLCDGDVPRGSAIFEITRLCLPARFSASQRLAIRNRLISAMVDHASQAGISTFTGVVETGFRDQVLAMGWRASPLGPSRRSGGRMLGAFRIEIDGATPGLLEHNRIYTPGTIGWAADVRAVPAGI